MAERTPSTSALVLRRWRKRAEKAVLKSTAASEAGGWLAYHYMRLVHRTNGLVEGSDDISAALAGNTPVIVAYWHGQHIFAPILRPTDLPMAALISKNSDADLNAVLLRHAGVETVRGSGGRDERQNLDRGGAKALLQLKRRLDNGISVNMIADISKLEARRAGLGIVTLAKLSGRPILPIAFATSRHKVLQKTWDKTTLSLPFGKSAIALGAMIKVPRDADENGLTLARENLNAGLNKATDRAYRLVGATDPAQRFAETEPLMTKPTSIDP